MLVRRYTYVRKAHNSNREGGYFRFDAPYKCRDAHLGAYITGADIPGALEDFVGQEQQKAVLAQCALSVREYDSYCRAC